MGSDIFSDFMGKYRLMKFEYVRVHEKTKPAKEGAKPEYYYQLSLLMDDANGLAPKGDTLEAALADAEVEMKMWVKRKIDRLEQNKVEIDKEIQALGVKAELLKDVTYEPWKD